MSEHLGDRFVSAPSPDHLTRTLTSRDGTVIGYRQLGSGPGFVLLHGVSGTFVLPADSVVAAVSPSRMFGAGPHPVLWLCRHVSYRKILDSPQLLTSQS